MVELTGHEGGNAGNGQAKPTGPSGDQTTQAEGVEGRRQAKGNAGPQNMPREQNRTSVHSAWDRDRKMARCRSGLDWEGQIALSFNPERVRRWRSEVPPAESDVCSMCGEFCAIRTVRRALQKKD